MRIAQLVPVSGVVAVYAVRGGTTDPRSVMAMALVEDGTNQYLVPVVVNAEGQFSALADQDPLYLGVADGMDGSARVTFEARAAELLKHLP